MDKACEGPLFNMAPLFNKRSTWSSLLLSLKHPSLASKLLLQSLVKYIRRVWLKARTASPKESGFQLQDVLHFQPTLLLKLFPVEYWPLWSLVMPLLSRIWPFWSYLDPVSLLLRQTYIDSIYHQHTQSHRWLSTFLEDTLAAKSSRNLEITDFPTNRGRPEKSQKKRPYYSIDPLDSTRLIIAEDDFPVNFRPLGVRVFWFYKFGTLFRVEKNARRTSRQVPARTWGAEGSVEEDYDPSIHIRSFSRSQKPLVKFLKFAQDNYNASFKQFRYVQMYILNRHSSNWHQGRPKPGRSLDSIVLPQRMKEALLQDAADFFNSKEWYAERGTPWKRGKSMHCEASKHLTDLSCVNLGWVLYGPPGCGKTSVISALATSFDLPIHILPVGSLLSDTTMAHAMSGIGSKCILVLEDIHALFTLDKANQPQARSDDSWFGTGNGSTATLSTLLNVLDGLDSGEARITIATSNVAPSRMFDDALCRPGRFDRFFHFKNASSRAGTGAIPYVLQGFSRRIGQPQQVRCRGDLEACEEMGGHD